MIPEIGGGIESAIGEKRLLDASDEKVAKVLHIAGKNRNALIALSNKEVQETVMIEGQEYDINTTTEIKIKGEIIPEEILKLKNLTDLVANSAKEIPDTLVNLTYLGADSAKGIPTTLKKLGRLKTRVKFNPEDFPNLKYVWDYDKNDWKVLKKEEE